MINLVILFIGAFGSGGRRDGEAIVNALVAGETMTGRDGHRINAISQDKLKAALKQFGRLSQ